ncbi:unnamed protein product [Calicophoron daubneyi]|uniref:Ribonuclease n=1 Tax=Calicophoron daubneyi TaxID=300641 RepID=A0AAV2TQY3_CALDB
MDLVSKKSPCMLGIDEAGRGPVLDSKTLTEDQREKLLKEMLSRTSWLTSGVHVISPVFITEKMLDRLKTSLNTISHDAAIGLIRSALDAGIHVTEVYVDTVGKAERYQTKLEGLFPQLKICVESKADDTYAIVSAASIFAKVTRDRLLQLWPHSHRGEVPHDTPLGSGYPGDPLTKKYLEACLDPVFGFPPLVRSSWSTATTLLDKRGVHMTWEDDEDFEKMAEAKRLARKREMARGTCKLSAFFAAEVKPESKRALTRRPYFIRSGLEHVENLV